MPLSNSYDFANFEPGWRKHAKYRTAIDPRDVSWWLDDIWTTITPVSLPTEQSAKSAKAMLQLEAFVERLPVFASDYIYNLVDERLRYALGDPESSKSNRFKRIISRAYEAADNVASQLAYERTLFAECKRAATAIFDSMPNQDIHHTTKKSGKSDLQTAVARGKFLLRELTFSEDDSGQQTEPSNIASLSTTEIANWLMNLHEEFTSRGRKPDIPLQFFLLRLAECYSITTGQEPNLSYKPVTPKNGDSPSLSDWQKFICLVVEVVGLPVQPSTLDHPMRELKNNPTFRGTLSYLSDPSRLVALRRSKNIGLGDLPSVGIQIDYWCQQFYLVGEFPPKRRTWEEAYPSFTS